MTIIPIPVGPEPPPENRWVGADVARRIRVRCTVTAVVLLLWAPLATVMTLLLGGRLPTADHPIHDLAIILAVVAAVLMLIVGVAALGARRYVAAEHVNVAGGRVLGRGILAMAVYCFVCAVLAGAVLVFTAGGVEGATEGSGAAAIRAYLLLPMSCGVIALVGAVLIRRALRPRGAAH